MGDPCGTLSTPLKFWNFSFKKSWGKNVNLSIDYKMSITTSEIKIPSMMNINCVLTETQAVVESEGKK